jgi:hypothetical protein
MEWACEIGAGSRQRPVAEEGARVEERTSANSMKVLLQRTAGPYIRVISDRGGPSHTTVHVRFAPKATLGHQDAIRR